MIAVAWTAVTGFFARRPLLVLYGLIAGAVLGFVLHYRALTRDIDDLEAKAIRADLLLTEQKAATDSAVKRAEEIATDYTDLTLVLQQLQEQGDDIRKENNQLRARIERLRLDVLVAEQPGVASVVATTEYNASRRLLECETDPRGPRPCSPAGSAD